MELLILLAAVVIFVIALAARDNRDQPGCGTAGLFLFAIVFFAAIAIATGGTFAAR